MSRLSRSERRLNRCIGHVRDIYKFTGREHVYLGGVRMVVKSRISMHPEAVVHGGCDYKFRRGCTGRIGRRSTYIQIELSRFDLPARDLAGMLLHGWLLVSWYDAEEGVCCAELHKPGDLRRNYRVVVTRSAQAWDEGESMEVPS